MLVDSMLVAAGVAAMFVVLAAVRAGEDFQIRPKQSARQSHASRRSF
ncbi:MAG: hypothetical protein Q7J60_03370 [Bradyrhizobium sp.]|nr:hypothetical protein [Bradyrhizobium sp.]MDO9560637.1 hypothetical protein [Bradyrhizobium sp.]MDP3691224.1 hypothetical protein [Bradyrhizobium sp.]